MQKTTTGILHKMMLSCEQATYLIVKSEDRKLPPGKRIRLAFHLVMCRFCRAFKIQSRLLNTYLHGMLDEAAVPGAALTLDPASKQELEVLLHDHLLPPPEKK